jgi:uncharacterized protein YqgC (DUF456 family)
VDSLLWALSILFILVGIISRFLTALPGMVLVFPGLLVVAWIDRLFFRSAGVLIGLITGGALGEYEARGNLGQAGKAAVGSWLGFTLGAAAKLALAFVMIGRFLLSYPLV